MYTRYQEFIAELLGTMCILVFGNGVGAMHILYGLADYTTITITWGAAVFLGILLSNRISGAHLNPAVTLALTLTGRFPLKKSFHYITAQMIGGFLGAALVYCFYSAKLKLVDPTLAHSAGIFTTFSTTPGFMPGFMSEVIATAILLFGILAIIDHFATEKTGYLAPFAIGGLIMAIGMGLGGMHGYAMNPARDFSPRVFITLMGFQNNGLTNHSYEWAQTILGSLLGGPLGALLYNITLSKKIKPYCVDTQNYGK